MMVVIVKKHVPWHRVESTQRSEEPVFYALPNLRYFIFIHAAIFKLT